MFSFITIYYCQKCPLYSLLRKISFTKEYVLFVSNGRLHIKIEHKFKNSIKTTPFYYIFEIYVQKIPNLKFSCFSANSYRPLKNRIRQQFSNPVQNGGNAKHDRV